MRVPAIPAMVVLVIGLAGIGCPSLVSAEDKATITVSKSDCKLLVRHVPSADVAYQPGVDVRGNKVVGADLPGSASAIKLPDRIQFDLTYDLLKDYGISDESPLAAIGEASLGKVEYNLLNGSLTFNGAPLDDPEQAMLAAACKSAE